MLLCHVLWNAKKPAISHDFMDERLPNRFPLLPPPPQAFQIRLKRTAGRRLWEGELNLIFSVLNRPNCDFWSLSDMNSFSGDCVRDWISAMWLVLTKYHHTCGWKLPGSQRTDGDICPNHKQESCSPADTILGSCWVKAALYENPRKRDKGGRAGGGRSAIWSWWRTWDSLRVFRIWLQISKFLFLEWGSRCSWKCLFYNDQELFITLGF